MSGCRIFSGMEIHLGLNIGDVTVATWKLMATWGQSKMQGKKLINSRENRAGQRNTGGGKESRTVHPPWGGKIHRVARLREKEVSISLEGQVTEWEMTSSSLPHSLAQNHIHIYTHIYTAVTLFISPTLFSQYLAYYRYHSLSTHLNVVCTCCSTKCFVWFFYIKNKNCISTPSIILDKHHVKSLKWGRNKVF